MFPREQGYAELFTLFEEEEVPKNFGLTVCDYPSRALIELQKRGEQLVYGDLVKVGNHEDLGFMIYDGEKLVYLDYITTVDGCIPKEFTVVKSDKTEKEVPIDYYTRHIYWGYFHLLPELFEKVEFSNDYMVDYTIKISDKLSLVFPWDMYSENGAYNEFLFLNKYIHSGVTVTAIQWEEVYVIEVTDEERQKCMGTHMVKAVF